MAQKRTGSKRPSADSASSYCPQDQVGKRASAQQLRTAIDEHPASNESIELVTRELELASQKLGNKAWIGQQADPNARVWSATYTVDLTKRYIEAGLSNVAQTQRRTKDWSQKANAAKVRTKLANREQWRMVGAQLRATNPNWSNSHLARVIANRTGAKEATIRAALRELGLNKKLSIP